MTEASKTYAADGQELCVCTSCMSNGRSMWLPRGEMRFRNKFGRQMAYCKSCWRERQMALKAVRRVG